MTIDGLPEFIRLLGAGRLETRDSRGPFFNWDPEAIIEATNAQRMKSGLPVDIDHATDYASPKGLPAPAAGWIVALEVRDGEVWGRISWTTLGIESLSRGPNGEPPAYRYTSPVFMHDPDSGEIKALLRCSLVNSPNLFGTEICSQRKPPMTTAQKIAVLRAELAPNSRRDDNEKSSKEREKLLTKLHKGGVMTAAEKEVSGRFLHVSDAQFVAESARRAAREADKGATFDIRPFVMKKVGVRFAPLGKH